jgi:hypothetical protein
MRNRVKKFAGLIVAVVGSLVVVPGVLAADVTPTVDTPLSFRATFKGLDTDPQSLSGNDFQVFEFNYWTVLVNLRGDGVDLNGDEFGFYEIQLTRTGSTIADPSAPIVKTSLIYSGLQPGVTMTDKSLSSGQHGDGSEYLTTSVGIRYEPSAGAVFFEGTIAGDSDLNGDGIVDSDQTSTDVIVKTLQTLKDAGVITGKEMGQIIKQTNQPRK